MAINLDPAQGASAPSAGRLDRHDAEARQDRWMQELERAMLSGSAKKQRAAQPQRGDAPAQREIGRPSGADEMPGTAAQRLTGTAAGASAVGRGADVPQAGRGSSERGAELRAGDDASAEQKLTDTRAGDQGAAAGVPVNARALAGVQHPAADSNAAGAAGFAPAANTVLGASTTAAAGSAHVESIQAAQATQQTAAPPALALGPSAEPRPDSTTPADVGPDLTEQADSGAAALADVTEFDKRLIHLFSGPDGMHAYIRDAELGAAQMRSVAAALSTELALAGQALTTLTVNGKRIDLTSKDAPGPDFATDGGGSPLQSLTPVRKEPSE
jgi:hypothetical protein